jgi:hypothetical protein
MIPSILSVPAQVGGFFKETIGKSRLNLLSANQSFFNGTASFSYQRVIYYRCQTGRPLIRCAGCSVDGKNLLQFLSPPSHYHGPNT